MRGLGDFIEVRWKRQERAKRVSTKIFVRAGCSWNVLFFDSAERNVCAEKLKEDDQRSANEYNYQSFRGIVLFVFHFVVIND